MQGINAQLWRNSAKQPKCQIGILKLLTEHFNGFRSLLRFFRKKKKNKLDWNKDGIEKLKIYLITSS